MSEIKINGFKCRYELSGNPQANETIIFINGIASPMEAWGEIKQTFEKDYTVLGYDLRGQWHSEVTASETFSFVTMANDLNALMEELGIEKAHVIGTSLGGEVGLSFATIYPSKLHSLSVVASVSEATELQYRQVLRWKNSAQAAVDEIDASGNDPEIVKKMGVKFYEAIFPELYSNTFLEANLDEVNERTLRFVNACNRDFFQGHVYLCEMFLRLRTDEKLTGKLHKISCPALIVAGEVDLIKPPSFSIIMDENIPNSKLVIMDDVGHAAIHEKPEEIASMIREFIINSR